MTAEDAESNALTPHVITDVLDGFAFPASGPTRRLVGDRAFHNAEFLQRYDRHTVFYGAVFEPETSEVLLFGPPLLNFRRLIEQAEFWIDHRPQPIKEIRPISRGTVIAFAANDATELSFQIGGYEGRMSISKSAVDTFAGSNGLYTISLNNELQWIGDWLGYYVRCHGAESVVLIDNGSTHYSLEKLRQTLLGVEGLRKGVIVSAPFPFGPTASNSAGYAALFLQRTLVEFIRLKFFRKARAVMNADIDELIFSRRGQSVYDATVASKDGYVRANATWVYLPESQPPKIPRHLDHTCISSNGRPKANRKFCVAPTGPQRGKQWLTHFINSKKDPVDTDFTLWHFRSISTNWKYDRQSHDVPLIECPSLKDAMARAFPA